MTTNSFTYNGLNTRLGKVDSGGTKTFKRDGAYITDPVLTDGAAKFTPGISEKRGSDTKYSLSNYLSSTTKLIEPDNDVSDTKQYDAFGNMTSTSGSTPHPFNFAGQWGYQTDSDTNIQLLGHRYYDPTLGRFLTRDPAKEERNDYAYCENNPLANVDAFGLQTHSSTTNPSGLLVLMDLYKDGLIEISKTQLKQASRTVVKWAEKRGLKIWEHAGERAIQRLDKLDDLVDIYKNGYAYRDKITKDLYLYHKSLKQAIVVTRDGTVKTVLRRSNNVPKDWRPISKDFLREIK